MTFYTIFIQPVVPLPISVALVFEKPWQRTSKEERYTFSCSFRGSNSESYGLEPIHTQRFVFVQLRFLCVLAKCQYVHITHLGSGESASICCSNMTLQKLSVKQLATIVLLLNKDEKRVTGKKKIMWVHECLVQRKSESEF